MEVNQSLSFGVHSMKNLPLVVSHGAASPSVSASRRRAGQVADAAARNVSARFRFVVPSPASVDPREFVAIQNRAVATIDDW